MRGIHGNMLNFLNDDLIEYYMGAALAEASAACEANTDCNDIPVGCIIADDMGNIVARAHNTREKTHLVTGHAEISAINKATEILGDYRLDNYYIFVTLEPCPMCAGAIAAARPKAIYYGAPNKVNGACGTVYNVMPPHTPVFGGIMARKAGSLVSDFFNKLRH